jgi:hypothetical protein
LLILDTEALTPLKAASTTLFSAEYTTNGQTFERSIILGGGQDLEKFGTRGYAVVDSGGVFTSTDDGALYLKHKMTGIDIETYPPRYGSFPSADVWYISLGSFPSAPAPAPSVASQEWKIEKQLTETFQIRRNLTTGNLYHHRVPTSTFSSKAFESFEGSYTAGIAKTTDGGKTWSMLYSSKNEFYFNDIDCVSETHCVAVAEGHGSATPGVHIFTTVDGTNFYPMLTENDKDAGLMGVKMVSDNEVFAIGGEESGLLNVKIYHSLNGGFNFTMDKPVDLTGLSGMDLDCYDGSHCFTSAVTVTKQMTLVSFK